MSEPIFVFATNESGHHENPMAVLAMHSYGAQKSQGRGLVGQSYAIPVLDRNGQRLSEERIVAEFNAFKEFARSHPEMNFQLTRIGCDTIGFRDNKVSKFFMDCSPNVTLPGVWERIRTPEYRVMAIVGSVNFSHKEIVEDCLKMILDFYDQTTPITEFIVSDDEGVDFIAAAYLAGQGRPCRIIKADWDKDPKRAGAVRNRAIGLIATDLILFDDGNCGKCAHMRKTANSEGLYLMEAAVSYTETHEQNRILEKPEVAQKVRDLSANFFG